MVCFVRDTWKLETSRPGQENTENKSRRPMRDNGEGASMWLARNYWFCLARISIEADSTSQLTRTQLLNNVTVSQPLCAHYASMHVAQEVEATAWWS